MHGNRSSKNIGFTLMELMVTMSIAGIVLSIAVPSFNATIRSNRLTAYANDLVTSLNLARSEAVNRERRVVVRKTGANWENGWQVFVDISRAGANADVFDDNGDTLLCEANEDCLLRVHEPIQSSFTLRGSNNFVDYVRYQSDGTISVIAGGSFVICDNSDGNNIPEAYTSRLILVNGVGRTQMGADADNNGIPEKEDGTEISSCIAGF